MDPIVVEESMEKFEAWIEDQAELPKNFDKILLLRYLKASEFDLEKAKKLLTNSLHMRHKNPHIFTQRDPHSKEIQDVISIVWVFRSKSLIEKWSRFLKKFRKKLFNKFLHC